MFSKIQEFAEKSVTLKEARENVKEMSLIREVGLYIVLIVVMFVVMGLVQLILIFASGPVDVNALRIINMNDYLLPSLFAFIVIPFIIYLYVSKIEKRSWRSIGFTRRNAISSTLKGLLIGFFMMFSVLIIGLIFGQYQYNGIDMSSTILFIPFLLGYAVQSFGEEIYTRGWTLTYFSKRHSIYLAILINSIIFVIPHLTNKGIDLLSIINILIISLLFAILLLKYDNIWICGGLHTAWNFTQGILFGFQVSGIVTPNSLLKFSTVNSTIINGGIFGPESSLIATFVIIVTIIIVLVYPKKNSNTN